MIDCGKIYQNDINGCSGGSLGGTFNFLNSYGFITEQKYPFKGKNNICTFTNN